MGILVCLIVASLMANAADFVLEIYGNANMDEYLNQKDIQCLEGIINGTTPATTLADANFDGKVDNADIEQVSAILDGKETKITYIDMLGES